MFNLKQDGEDAGSSSKMGVRNSQGEVGGDLLKSVQCPTAGQARRVPALNETEER